MTSSKVENTKLTVEEIRCSEGFEKITNEEALRIIENLHTYCSLAYKAYINLLNRKDNGH